jgi:hypothetical protein
MNRARRGVNLFRDKADYQQFIDLLQETADLFNVNVAAFGLKRYSSVSSAVVRVKIKLQKDTARYFLFSKITAQRDKKR